MCDDYALKDPRIRVIHKSNGGLSSARNAGLDIAKGDYIGFIDSDDFITPDMYAELFRLLTENNADAAICSFQRVSEEGDPLQFDDTLDDEVLSGEEALDKYMTVQWRYCLACNKLCKACVFSGLRFPEGRIHEDNATIHHILAKCRKVVTTSQAFYIYAIRSGSIKQTVGSSYNVRRVNDLIYIYEDMYTFFAQTGRKKLADLAALKLHRFLKGVLNEMSCLRNMKLLAPAVAFSVKASLKARGLKMKLRPAKLLLAILRNIVRIH